MLRKTKSHWFARGRPRDAATIAGLAAFTAWRLALHAIRQLRSAQFEIEASPQYFDYVRDYLVFLAHIADRLALQRYDAAQREAFTVAMCRRLAELLAENQSDLLGGDAEAIRRGFIDAFNDQAEAYASFDFGPDGPGFDFVRYCAHRLLDAASERDRAWLIDQIITIEAPEAVDTLRQVIDNALASAGAAAAPEP